RSSASVAGSTCTCTWARPSESLTARSTWSVVSWVCSRLCRRDTPITTSAKLSPPASRTRTERTSATPATPHTARPATRVSPDRGPGQEHRLGEGGEVLGLAVAVGMLPVGRALRDADREEREDRGDGIDAGVRRLGQHAEAPACKTDRKLDQHKRQSGHQRQQ